MLSSRKNKIKYNYIDYKAPVQPLQNDFRTSTHLGHRYFKQNDNITPSRNSIISPCYTLRQKEIRYDYTTEQSSQYNPKLNFNRTNKADLNMCCKKPEFGKAMQHRMFSNPPKAIRNYSAYSKDFVFKPQLDQNVIMISQVSRPYQLADYADVDDVGCYKYSSTNMNVYKVPKDVEGPGCSKENVTIWNYVRQPKYMASDLPKYNLVPNRPKILRYNGMKSENKNSFIVPLPKKFKCDIFGYLCVISE